MNPDSSPHAKLTRRDALQRVLAVSIVAATTAPVATSAAPVPAPPVEMEFVPENDYPFFGYQPESEEVR